MFFGRYIKAHHVSRAALVAAGLGAAIVFFVVGAAIRLLIGPVSLGPLGSTLSGAIAEALPGITVQYDQAAIEWSRDQGRVNLVILGARVFDGQGRIIAQAPEADIDLAARPLLQGKAVVRRITLVGVQLALVRTLKGQLRLGVEKDDSRQDILDRISDAISKTNGTTSSLQTFAVRQARLAFYDEPTGLFFVAPSASFVVATAGANLKASLDAAVEISGHPAHITAEFTLPPAKGPVSGSVAVEGLDLRALASDSRKFASVKRIGLVVDASASFAVQGVRLLSADFGIGAKGNIDMPGLAHGPLKVRALQVVGRYDGKTGRLLIEDGTLDAGGVSAHLTGWGDLVRDPGGAMARVDFETRADKIALAMPGVLAAPVSLRVAAARGEYLAATKDIVFDHLEVAGGALSVQAAGKLTLVPDKTPAVEIKGQMAPLAVRDLLRYWPLTLGRGARDWIDRNMPAGALGAVGFEAHLPAGLLDQSALPDGALKVTIPLGGAEANYVQGLTHLTQLRGVATLTGDTFSAAIASANIGPLAVSQGHVVIANLHVPESPGDFSAHVAGTMPQILALVDMKPLKYATRFGVDIAQTKGQAAVDLSFHLPMKKNLGIDEVAIAIKAAVGGFSIAIGEHARLTDGAVEFAIDNAKLHAAGSALLADSRLSFDWSEDFRTPNPVTTRIAVKGTLDNGGRAALNFASASFLTGPGPISATLTGHRGALLSADMTMDLTPAALGLDLIGLNKPAGSPATAHVGATFGPESTIKNEALRITGPGIAANGSVAFDKDGHMSSLAFPLVHFGANNEFSLNLTRGAGGSDIVIRGRSVDGSRLGGHGSGDDTMLNGPFHVSARLDRLMLRDGVAVSPFSLDVSGVGNRPSALALSGSLTKSASVSGDIAAGDSGRRITLSTTDAGLLAKGLFGFTSLKGGRAELTALLPGKAADTAPADPAGPDYQGKLSVRDFKVLNQPFLTRLFSAGSLGGLVNLMQGQGIAVDKLDVPFSSRNGVIDVQGGRATGPAIGLTADGYIDRPKNAIALKGSLVPLFGLNSVLGSIPLVGNVLVSKQGEGVFGMTYSIRGNADQPDVSVNPLSVLTPGILRRVFQGQMPNAAQAPTNNPPPAVPPPTKPE